MTVLGVQNPGHDVGVAQPVLEGQGHPAGSQYLLGRFTGLGGLEPLDENDHQVGRTGPAVVGKNIQLDLADPALALDGQPVPFDGLDVLLPDVNQLHIQTGLGHQRPEQAAHGPGSDKGDFHASAS